MDYLEKPRTQGNHLTEEEIKILRTAFNCGLNAKQAAFQVRCSTRIAYKYFTMFRAGIIPRRQQKKFVYRPNDVALAIIPPPPPIAPSVEQVRASRFYKGNFEL